MCLFFFLQDVDKWSFDVFALNEASGEHSLKFMIYELFTRYDLINRFKVRNMKPKWNALRFGYLNKNEHAEHWAVNHSILNVSS
jgi:hypothetical protein